MRPPRVSVTDTAGIAERYPAALQPLLIPDPNDATDLAARLRAWRSAAGGFAPAVATLSAQGLFAPTPGTAWPSSSPGLVGGAATDISYY